MEYDPVPCVKQHSLDERLRETMCDAKVHDLKEQVALVEELLMDMSSEQKLSAGTNRHRAILLKLVSSNLKKVK
jgi:hypothetical protein